MAPSFVTVTSYIRSTCRPVLQIQTVWRCAHANIVHHHLVQPARAEGALDHICDGLSCENCRRLGQQATRQSSVQQQAGIVRCSGRGGNHLHIPFWSRMSEPEIFCPPRNNVPFLGCSNMDAMMKSTQHSRVCVAVDRVKRLGSGG